MSNNLFCKIKRDIKTLNIFVMQSGVLKLGDFGIAKLLDKSEEFAKTIVGTPYYLSPEIWKEKRYSRASDIWALGVILYELLNLKKPFPAQDKDELVNKVYT